MYVYTYVCTYVHMAVARNTDCEWAAEIPGNALTHFSFLLELRTYVAPSGSSSIKKKKKKKKEKVLTQRLRVPWPRDTCRRGRLRQVSEWTEARGSSVRQAQPRAAEILKITVSSFNGVVSECRIERSREACSQFWNIMSGTWRKFLQRMKRKNEI